MTEVFTNHSETSLAIEKLPVGSELREVFQHELDDRILPQNLPGEHS